MSITLPKLPHPVMNAMLGDDCEDLFTADQLRARDIEVARLVLEAAANLCDQQAREAYKRWRSKENAYDDGGCDIANMLASSIRALEVHHHE